MPFVEEPLVTVIQPLLLTAVQGQPAPAVTFTEYVPPAAAALALVLLRLYVHALTAFTVIVAVRVMPPPLAAIVTVAVVVGACALAVSVKVLEVEPAGMVAGDHVAASHDGRPEAAIVTGELNPPLVVS